MKKYRLLDLFCGAGGAAVGYHRAGFEVVGVDIKPQKHYPFKFHQADAMTYPLDGFDVIHASPPCQRYSQMRFLSKARNCGQYPVHPDLLDGVRKRLEADGKPFIIENVPQSPIRKDITLCGTMFGLKVYRHRHFESNIRLLQPDHKPHRDKSPGAGNGLSPKGFITATKQGGIRGMKEREIVAYISMAMGIDWADRKGMGEAIPPAYTFWIGQQLMEYLRGKDSKAESQQ